MQLGSVDEAIDVLARYIPHTLSHRTNYNLDRMTAFLDDLGRPQDAVRVVHVAGTSGKTSTAYLVRALLQSAGQHTGLTVSPHIRSLTERVQVGGLPLDNASFLAVLGEFLDLVVDRGIPLTYFEVLVAFAYWTFARYTVDYAVVEVGLGGLLDGTNVVTRADKIAVITDLGLDHTEILGDSIEAIAVQKAGIVQPGNEVFMLAQEAAVTGTVATETVARGGRLHLVDPARGTAPAALPPFQQRNWTLAAAVYDFVADRDGLAPRDNAVASAPDALPPGRMEHRTVSGREVIFDGAHNPQKLAALRGALRATGLSGLAVLATFIQSPREKLDAALDVLAPVTAHLIVPEFTARQDLAKMSFPGLEVAERAGLAGIGSVEVVPDLPTAFATLLRRPEPGLLVTGSLYLIGQVFDRLQP